MLRGARALSLSLSLFSPATLSKCIAVCEGGWRLGQHLSHRYRLTPPHPDPAVHFVCLLSQGFLDSDPFSTLVLAFHLSFCVFVYVWGEGERESADKRTQTQTRECADFPVFSDWVRRFWSRTGCLCFSGLPWCAFGCGVCVCASGCLRVKSLNARHSSLYTRVRRRAHTHTHTHTHTLCLSHGMGR